MLFGIDALFDGVIRNSVRGAAGYAWAAAASATESVESSGFFSSRETLAEENALLRSELSERAYLVVENELLQAENEALREQLALDAEMPVAVARVLSSPSASPYATLVVQAGAVNGVRVGDLVVAGNSVALGHVIEAGAGTALVQLAFAPGAETEGLLGGTAIVPVSGRGGQGVAHVPRDIAVAEGDVVFLPGTPYALGVVGSISLRDADAYQTVRIALPESLADIRFVQVVRAPDLPAESTQ